MYLMGHLRLKIKNYFLITKLFQPLHMEGLAEGIIHIDGYEYIGYFKEAELHPSRPVSTEQPQLPVEKQSSKEIEENRSHSRNICCCSETCYRKPSSPNSGLPLLLKKNQFLRNLRLDRKRAWWRFLLTVTNPDANLAEGQTRIVSAGVKVSVVL